MEKLNWFGSNQIYTYMVIYFIIFKIFYLGVIKISMNCLLVSWFVLGLFHVHWFMLNIIYSTISFVIEFTQLEAEVLLKFIVYIYDNNKHLHTLRCVFFVYKLTHKNKCIFYCVLKYFVRYELSDYYKFHDFFLLYVVDHVLIYSISFFFIAMVFLVCSYNI